MNKVVFSSKTNEWATPSAFFEKLNAEFGFTLDPCATDENHKCERYYTIKDDGLSRSWDGVVFCNPPYGRQLPLWVEKAYKEHQQHNITIVMLIPARTDTRYFHEYVYHKADEIRFVKGRLKFGDSEKGAPFPSMVVVYKKK